MVRYIYHQTPTFKEIINLLLKINQNIDELNDAINKKFKKMIFNIFNDLE
jgi:hypothetical protein